MGGRINRAMVMLCSWSAPCLALACANKPASGKYCALERTDECVYVDLDHELLTFYDRGAPSDVPASFSSGAVDVEPKVGKFAGKKLRLAFHAGDPSRFTLHTPEAQVIYARK